MVKMMLRICADLDSLTYLQPEGGCDDPNFTYLFKLKCGQCGEVTEKETCLSLSETVPSAKGKSDIHLSQKCKFCSREGTITMIEGRGHPLTQAHAQRQVSAPLMLFDCRGFEPLDFVFGAGWKAESMKGTKFTNIDLSDGEFSEYDEKGECPVMITNLRAIFEPVKG